MPENAFGIIIQYLHIAFIGISTGNMYNTAFIAAHLRKSVCINNVSIRKRNHFYVKKNLYLTY